MASSARSQACAAAPAGAEEVASVPARGGSLSSPRCPAASLRLQIVSATAHAAALVVANAGSCCHAAATWTMSMPTLGKRTLEC